MSTTTDRLQFPQPEEEPQRKFLDNFPFTRRKQIHQKDEMPYSEAKRRVLAAADKLEKMAREGDEVDEPLHAYFASHCMALLARRFIIIPPADEISSDERREGEEGTTL